MNPSELPLVEVLTRLAGIVADGLAPERALEQLRELRARHPEQRIELVWEDDVAGRPQYELLMGAQGQPTLCLSLVPAESSPFAMRGAQRWTEAQLVSINGRRVFVYEAMLMLDAIWGEARILDRLVEHHLLGLELERDPIDVDDAALQAAVDEFRVERGLLAAADTERWLADHGMSQTDLEHVLASEIAVRGLRRRLVGERIEGCFASDPAAWDTVAAIAFPVADLDAGRACVAALADGANLLELAERTLASRTAAARTARSISFESLHRRDIELLHGRGIAEGEALLAELCGRGPYVIVVRSVTAAVLDDATRAAIEHELFTAWSTRARAEAHVEWNWGPREA